MSVCIQVVRIVVVGHGAGMTSSVAACNQAVLFVVVVYSLNVMFVVVVYKCIVMVWDRVKLFVVVGGTTTPCGCREWVCARVSVIGAKFWIRISSS